MSIETSVDGVVTKDSPHAVDGTVARLRHLAESKGLTVFAVIDHRAEAEAVGLALRETKVVLFGSPRAGTPVMEAVPLAALDLPLKILVWADGDRTRISYTAPAALALRYHLSEELAVRLAGIEALAEALTHR